MENTKTEPHDTQEGYCCACGFDMIELKEREAAAFKRGLEEGKREYRDMLANLMSGNFTTNGSALPDEGADKSV